MNIGKASLKLFTSNITVSIISFLALIYFTRALPSDDLGSFFLFQALLGILSIPTDFGILGAVEKRISEEDAPARVLTTAFIMKLVPLIIIVLGILLLRGQVNAYLNGRLALWLIIGLILQTMKELMIKVLRGELRVGETASLQLVSKATWALLGSVLVFLDYDVYGLIYALLTGFLIVFIWGMYKRSTPFGRPSWEKAQSIFNYAKFNVISSVGSYVNGWMDVAMLGLFVTPSLVSAYEVAWRVSSLLLMFSRAIATSLFPQVSKLDSDDEQGQIETLMPKMILFGLVFVIPGFFGLAIFSQEVLRLIFTPEYAVAATVLILLAGERLFHSIHMITGRTLNAIDQPRLSAQATAIAIIANVLLNIILIWRFGIVGAALATGISFLIDMVLHLIYLSRFLTIRFPVGDILWLFISSLVMSAFLILFKEFVAITSLLTLFTAVTVGVAIYFFVLFLNTSIQMEFKREISKLFR